MVPLAGFVSLNPPDYFQKLGRMMLTLREDRIVWPGGLRQKPTGLMIPTHLKVIEIDDKKLFD